MPASAIRWIAAGDDLERLRIEPDRGLVEHHQRRVEHQRAGELDRAPLAAGEVARALLGALADQREELGDLVVSALDQRAGRGARCRRP